MSYFEYDDEKRQVNLDKHGINFLDAQALWKDPDLLEIQAKSADVPRFLIIGLIGQKHWSAVITNNSTHFCETFAQKGGRAV